MLAFQLPAVPASSTTPATRLAATRRDFLVFSAAFATSRPAIAATETLPPDVAVAEAAPRPAKAPAPKTESFCDSAQPPQQSPVDLPDASSGSPFRRAIATGTCRRPFIESSKPVDIVAIPKGPKSVHFTQPRPVPAAVVQAPAPKPAAPPPAPILPPGAGPTAVLDWEGHGKYGLVQLRIRGDDSELQFVFKLLVPEQQAPAAETTPAPAPTPKPKPPPAPVPDPDPPLILNWPGYGRYGLVQLHFHGTSSEHAINSVRGDGEAHFVFKLVEAETEEPARDGPPPTFMVVGVLFNKTKGQAEGAEPGYGLLSALQSLVPPRLTDCEKKEMDEKIAAGKAVAPTPKTTIDFADFLPDLGVTSFYKYNGSLTTPPCTPGVQWWVRDDILELDTVGSRILDRLVKTQQGDNYRPLQPLPDWRDAELEYYPKRGLIRKK